MQTCRRGWPVCARRTLLSFPDEAVLTRCQQGHASRTCRAAYVQVTLTVLAPVRTYPLLLLAASISILRDGKCGSIPQATPESREVAQNSKRCACDIYVCMLRNIYWYNTQVPAMCSLSLNNVVVFVLKRRNRPRVVYKGVHLQYQFIF